MKTEYTAKMTVEITRSGFEMKNSHGEIVETAEPANKGKLHRILSNNGYKPSATVFGLWEK